MPCAAKCTAQVTVAAAAAVLRRSPLASSFVARLDFEAAVTELAAMVMQRAAVVIELPMVREVSAAVHELVAPMALR